MNIKLPKPCLVCKSLHNIRYGLCPYCSEKLYELRKPLIQNENGIKIHSLFSWHRDGLRAYAWLIKSLKGQEHPEAWRELATWLRLAFQAAEPRVLIPIPSNGPNHALGFATALSECTGWPVTDVLASVKRDKQKSLTKAERQAARFSLKPCKDFSAVRIVDDIVTTGATVRAACQALGQPQNVEVWCLMNRHLL